ncbi:thiamine-phosphate synthase family protein [Thermococcus sp.]
MKTPSVYIAEELMPYLRAKIAQILYNKGLRQSKIASYLGITQAMVSKYLSGSYKKPSPDIMEILDPIAEQVAGFILSGASREEVIAFTARKILRLFSSGKLCRHYSSYAGISESACRSLFSTSPELHFLEETKIAVRELLSLPGFSRLIPEVRSNLAYAPANAETPEEVIAIPGRITLVKGRPYALPPEFGASRFTASLILSVSKKNPMVRSVLNIRLNESIEKAIKKSGLKFRKVKTGGLNDEEAIAVISALFEDDKLDAVLDEGGKGIEPLVYIFGSDPFEVVDKVKKIMEVME